MVDANRVVQAMQCVVCVEPCREAVITPCGHTYCRQCITECLNLKHSCPTCSQPVTVDQLVRNHAVDGAVDLLYSQAAGADNALAGSLISGTGFGAAVGAEGAGSGGGGGFGLSPVEAMFSEHMKTVLVGFKQHEDRLNAAHQLRLAALKAELKWVAWGPDGPTGAGAQVYLEREQQLDEQHKQSMGVLLSDLSGYLASAAVPPTLLPTTAAVVMRRGPGIGGDGGSGGGCGHDAPSKKEIRFQTRVLGITTAADVAAAAAKQFSLVGDDVTDMNDVALVLYPRGNTADPDANAGADAGAGARVSGVSDGDAAVMRLMAVGGDDSPGGLNGAPPSYGEATDTGGSCGKAGLTIRVALDCPTPLFKLVPGGRLDGSAWDLVLEGNFAVKSDAQMCFSLEFVKGADPPQKCDYYQCKTCAIKWICGRCASSCHAGHDVVPFQMGHTPTWACCYCAKKKSKTGCKLCQKR